MEEQENIEVKEEKKEKKKKSKNDAEIEALKELERVGTRNVCHMKITPQAIILFKKWLFHTRGNPV